MLNWIKRLFKKKKKQNMSTFSIDIELVDYDKTMANLTQLEAKLQTINQLSRATQIELKNLQQISKKI